MTTEIAAASGSAAQLSEIKIPQLPLREHGLTNVPAIPLDIVSMLDTLIRLGGKVKQREQALQGLSRTMTIGGATGPAYAFLFGREAPDAKAAVALERVRTFLNRNPLGLLSSLVDKLKAQEQELVRTAATGRDDLTTHSLDDPKQWSMGWTTFPDVYTLGLPHLDEFAATVDVTQPDRASEAFFPTIARFGRSYNLILTKKVKTRDVAPWRDLFGSAWTPALDAAAEAGLLYVIDLRIYETLKPQQVEGFPRFTPSTVTVLVQDPATKALTPELIRVAGADNQPKLFSRRGSTTPSAWVYALQAAKVSVTVYGIWLGHVYQWHLVTAAMLMTMFENLSANNPARKLLEPQSSYLIPFDNVLLMGWGSLAEVPPTSIATSWQFLELIDLFAKGRQFFDDDPTTTLERLGIVESDFTVNEPWDQYPIVGDLLDIWTATGRYVNTYVDQAYPADRDVQRDEELQRWIDASGRAQDGNVRGLPAMDSKDALKRVLHSLVYRIMAHGGSRMYRSANPVLTFVANSPRRYHHRPRHEGVRMSTIHMHQTTTSTPEQFLAALIDFGPGRSKVFGNSADDHLKVHHRGPSDADVTEGSGGIWERLHYDWTDPTRVVMTTTDSNLWGGRSGHIYTFTRRPDGTTDVDAVVVREGKNLKGRLLGLVLGTVGRGVLTKAFESTVKAIEARNGDALGERRSA